MRMQTKQVFCLLLINTLGAPMPGMTATIAPASTAYTATGPISFSKGVIHADCTIDVSGKVSADGRSLSIDKVVFSGSSFKCARVTPAHLPWTLTATSNSTADVSGISVNVRAPLVGGDCGPATAKATWDQTKNLLQITGATIGSCAIKTVTLRSTPAFHWSP